MKKKYIIIGGVALIALGLMNFATNTKKKAELVLPYLKFGYLPKLNTVRISGGALKFELDMTVTNPTGVDLHIGSAGLIQAKSYNLRLNGNLIAVGQLPSIHRIDLPAGGTQYLNGITVEIPLPNLGFEILTMIFEEGTSSGNKTVKQTTVQNVFKSIMKKLTLETNIQGFGTYYTHKHSFA